MTSADTYHHHSATVNSIQQQSASHCKCGHHTTSADTYHHHSATVNSMQQQLASHCNCGHPTKTYNIPVQHETSYDYMGLYSLYIKGDNEIFHMLILTGNDSQF